MNNHNFILGPVDTDSVSICKADMSYITKEERINLLAEINSLMPKMIRWEDDGYFSSVCVVRAKNYILKDESGKIKIKGSSLRATLKEVALKEFINKVIEYLLEDKISHIMPLYEHYVTEIYNIKDMTRWVSKKSITSKVLEGERTTEQKVLTAIEDSEYVEGDKCYMYFREDGSLGLLEHWKSDHDVNKLLEKLYKTIITFETILDIKQFPNYSLKRNLNLGRILAGLQPIIKEKKSAK
jgi:hypothetical protein